MLREVASISFILPLVISDQITANQAGKSIPDIKVVYE